METEVQTYKPRQIHIIYAMLLRSGAYEWSDVPDTEKPYVEVAYTQAYGVKPTA